MTINRRYVLDTNVLISAALLQSVAQQVLEKALSTGKLLQSADTQLELETVLQRPKFDRYLLPESRELFLLALKRAMIEVTITTRISECRDPKDDKFLELAVSGNADCIITGDRDLLDLHPFRDIPIVTPRSFLDDNPSG